MATLSSALNYALAGLSVAATQSALVSRNVSFASDENYSRKSAEIYTLPGGAPAISNYGRSMDKLLMEKLLGATTDASGKQVMIDALSRMAAVVGDPQDDSSFASQIGKLQQSLRSLEANPASQPLAASMLESARNVSDGLNTAAAEIINIRKDADSAMVESVERIKTLLQQFKIVNDSIVRGSGSADDLSESLDRRDGILKLLSEEVGIRTSTRPNNDVLIYADGGAVLFEGSPRAINIQATPVFGASTVGSAIFIDGVAVTGPTSTMPITGGKLSALAEIRDETAITLQRQVDEIAAGVIRWFAESDQSAVPTLPDVAGLFIDPDGDLPALGADSVGLAARIALNPLADPEQGGSLDLIRDGGFGGPPYVYNRLGSAAFQGRISELLEAFELNRSFDARAELGTTASLKVFSLQSAAWVERQRQSADAASESAGALRERANASLLRKTGVNIDQEMASLLDLEKSYQASSKVISTIDAMLATLLEAIR